MKNCYYCTQEILVSREHCLHFNSNLILNYENNLDLLNFLYL